MGAAGDLLTHFGGAHPLSVLARGRCRDVHGPRCRPAACGVCWEHALRDDERVVADFGLSRELVCDPLLVDEIAVELACRGERVRLTPVERRVAVFRLIGRGVLRTRIAAVLRMDRVTVSRLLDEVTAAANGLGSRHLAVLRAVAAGRAELTVSQAPDVFVDGQCCTDHTVAGVLTDADLIEAVEVAPLGSRVRARLTDRGAALLTTAVKSKAGPARGAA